MFGALTLVAGGLTTAFTTVNKIQNDEKRKEEEVRSISFHIRLLISNPLA